MDERATFASALLAGRNLAQADAARLEPLLAALVDRAMRTWPAVHVEPVAFVRHVGDKLPLGSAPFEALEAIHTSDLYVAYACSRGDPRAIAELEAAFFGDCDAALARMAAGPSFADEVKQRARVKLFVGDSGRPARIGEYSGRGELRSFLRVVIMREAISARRTDRRVAAAAEEAVNLHLDTSDPELYHLRRTYTAEFERAFRAAVRALTSEERNLLRYHYLERLNIDHIGAIYGIHRVSAARRLTKIRAALVESTRSRLADQLRLDGGELRSVLRLIESQVDISLRRVLGDASVGA